MDVRKSVRILAKTILILLGLIITSIVLLAWQILTLPEPNSCFKTPWHQVEVCENNPSHLKYEHVPKLFWRTLLISEDANFYNHQGLDFHELQESFKKNWSEGKIARGGSTITQQLAKNLYLSPEKSLLRKIKEAIIARRLEKSLSKKQILEKYINVIEFGPQIYGLKEAAGYHFKKDVKELNLLEIVYLVSIIPNPTELGESTIKLKLSSQNIWRMETILKRLAQVKQLTRSDYRYYLSLVKHNAWPFTSSLPATGHTDEPDAGYLDDFVEQDSDDLANPEETSLKETVEEGLDRENSTPQQQPTDPDTSDQSQQDPVPQDD